uniref:Exonuclease 1 n=1 Tax=Caenorhabditis tropicalis TaxID=1561998 RepID=A0A1I7V525_9PELO
MGITGLLPFVKNACRKGNILELRGKSVAIDVSCLLHRGLTGCMDKIHMGEETQSYVSYVNKYVKELLSMGCHVVMVFDGRPLPAKKGTNDDRREQREKRKEHAEMLLAKGMEREARDIYRLATSISADIVEKTIQHFRSSQENVDIIVAPYEADAQLAYLMEAKLVDAVITEDSDLIVFGCEKIYFKWQSATGECSVYEKSNLRKCFTGELGGDKFDFIKFRRICILSGCDYLQSGLPGVGLSTAAKFFSLTSIKDLRTVLRKVPSYLKMPKLKEHVNDEFIKSFEMAENTFKHQVVFDPRERCQKPLTPYPLTVETSDDLEIIDLESPTNSSDSASIASKFSYAGTAVTQRIAIRLALGNPADGNAIEDRFLLTHPTPDWSVWALKYESKGITEEKIQKRKDEDATKCGAFKLDSPAVKRVKVQKKQRKMEKKMIFILKKYSKPTSPAVKKPKLSNLMVDDDFSEMFQPKTDQSPTTECQENAPEKEIPAIQKSNSTPESNRKFQKFQSPLLTHQNSAPGAMQQPKTETNPRVSKYFVKKLEDGTPKPLSKNPFRCPAFVKPVQSSEITEDSSKKITLLSALEENVQEGRSSSTAYRLIGFKSTGLRRKSKN